MVMQNLSIFSAILDPNFAVAARRCCPSHIAWDVHHRPHQAVVQRRRLRGKEDQQGITDFVETRMGQLSVDVVVIAPLVKPQVQKRMTNKCKTDDRVPTTQILR